MLPVKPQNPAQGKIKAQKGGITQNDKANSQKLGVLGVLGQHLAGVDQIDGGIKEKHHGAVADVIPYLKNMHCLVNPSYHEGMSNVILEANAMCRPAIASDCMGCNDIITHFTELTASIH
jgi:glycosyltransferase involved in cell wall biosynthesis